MIRKEYIKREIVPPKNAAQEIPIDENNRGMPGRECPDEKREGYS